MRPRYPTYTQADRGWAEWIAWELEECCLATNLPTARLS